MTSKNDEIYEEGLLLPDVEDLIPSMNVNLPTQTEEKENNLVSDEVLMGIYTEIVDNIRKDREEIDDLVKNFVEMVINEGDSTSSSKEALVNLVKIKSDTADKMSKVADLMTRVKLKERDTFPRYLAANQTNTININENNSKRELIKQLQQAAKKEKK